jgi:chemotaxis protein MotB
MDFDEDDGGGEDWLVSYADMMTLIACFFILMMAFANYDPVGFNIKAEKLSQHFRKDKFKSSDMKLSQITEEVAKHELKDRAKISLKDGELIVTFSSSVIFQNGQTRLNENTLVTLDALIDVIKITNPNYRILIEGHADDDLTKFRNQWEISGLRASEVAARFQYFGFPKDMIVPIAKGDSQKLVTPDEKDSEKVKESKRSQNRRVVLRLLEPVEKKKVKFGFGIYFKDATENVKENDGKVLD